MGTQRTTRFRKALKNGAIQDGAMFVRVNYEGQDAQPGILQAMRETCLHQIKENSSYVQYGNKINVLDLTVAIPFTALTFISLTGIANGGSIVLDGVQIAPLYAVDAELATQTLSLVAALSNKFLTTPNTAVPAKELLDILLNWCNSQSVEVATATTVIDAILNLVPFDAVVSQGLDAGVILTKQLDRWTDHLTKTCPGFSTQEVIDLISNFLEDGETTIYNAANLMAAVHA